MRRHPVPLRLGFSRFVCLAQYLLRFVCSPLVSFRLFFFYLGFCFRDFVPFLRCPFSFFVSCCPCGLGRYDSGMDADIIKYTKEVVHRVAMCPICIRQSCRLLHRVLAWLALFSVCLLLFRYQYVLISIFPIFFLSRGTSLSSLCIHLASCSFFFPFSFAFRGIFRSTAYVHIYVSLSLRYVSVFKKKLCIIPGAAVFFF